MPIGENESVEPAQSYLFGWLSKSRVLRLSCLIGVAVFELGFTWFILHFGWLKSVDIWTQIGVIAIAALGCNYRNEQRASFLYKLSCQTFLYLI